MSDIRWAPMICNGINYGDRIEISTDGKLRNAQTKRVYKESAQEHGYGCVIRINNKRYYFNIVRCMAETFVPNPNNYTIYGYKDNNPLNRSIDNICWVKEGKKKHFYTQKHLTPEQIMYIKLNYEKYSRDFCMKQLAKRFGVSVYHIKQALKSP